MSLIYILTGDGKGKTTSAFGTTLRSLAKGKNVVIIQFFKNQKWFNIGETEFLRSLKIDNLEIYQFGRKGWINPKKPLEIDFINAKKGLNKTKYIINKKKPFLLVLDELLIGTLFNIINENDVIHIIKSAKKQNVNLIITGRGATKKIIKEADLVSEMKLIKHHYQNNHIATEGIEY